MIKVNITNQIKPNLMHRKELIKKVLLRKGWDVKRNTITIKEIGEDNDVKTYSEYEDIFKPYWGRFLNLI